jgi:hypothetical protein
VLAFVGLKMLAGKYVHVPELLSLGVVAILLTGTALASLMFPERKDAGPAER